MHCNPNHRVSSALLIRAVFHSNSSEIAPKVKTLTQFARGKQWFLPKPVVHLGNPTVRWMLKYIPGFHTAIRGLVFGVVDSFMKGRFVPRIVMILNKNLSYVYQEG